MMVPKTKKIRKGSELSEEFLAQAGADHGYAMSPLLFAIAADVIMDYA